MNILMALMRFGSRYAKGLSRPGLRVAGKTSRGKKVRGVLKRGKKGNFVISNQSVPTSVSKSDASRLTRSAKRASTVRKGLVGGGVGGSAIVGSTVANRKQPKSEPTYTEKNPGGMRFKKAPESKYLSYSRLGQEITRMEKLDPKREKGYSPKMSEPVATEKRPMGMKFSAAPKQSFGQAFNLARKQGEGTKFSWDGKDYVAVTKDDLKKRGLKSLKAWYKAKKK